jgi:hypothetical protein
MLSACSDFFVSKNMRAGLSLAWAGYQRLSELDQKSKTTNIGRNHLLINGSHPIPDRQIAVPRCTPLDYCITISILSQTANAAPGRSNGSNDGGNALTFVLSRK